MPAISIVARLRLPRSWRTMAALAVACPLLAAAADSALAGKIDRLFAKWDRQDTPGVVVGIARGGDTIHARGYGMANLEHGIPLSVDSISESGSVAKQFTAAALVLLEQRGQLALDDGVRKYLPALPASLADGITVRMLLNHTSGLRDIHGLFELMERPSYSSFHTNEEVLQVISRQRQLNFAPGTEYSYSNAGYILAALVVERVTRQSFGKFCEAEIFKPRGMLQTRWRDDFSAIVRGRAAGYEPRPAGGYRIDTPYSNLIGNGGLLTTIGDLLKWNASFDQATGEWARVVQAMQTPSKLSSGRVITYGLGLTIDDYAGLKEISHGGATSGYRTFLTRIPEKQLSIALLSNAADFNSAAVSHALVRAVLNLPAPKRIDGITLTRDQLASHAGRYHSKQTDLFLDLVVKQGALWEGGSELVATAPGKFVNGAGTVAFAFADGGQRVDVTTRTGESSFTRTTRVKPASAELGAYAGSYYSEELAVAHTILVREGRLYLSRWPGPSLAGDPTFADGFWFGRGWHATFMRDPHGKVTGYQLTNAGGRCRRIEFLRR